VAVDLPDNPQISGFVIAERFFSDALEAELYEPLGGVENFPRVEGEQIKQKVRPVCKT